MDEGDSSIQRSVTSNRATNNAKPRFHNQEEPMGLKQLNKTLK